MATDKVLASARRSEKCDEQLQRLLGRLADTPGAVTWVADAVEFLARTKNRTR